MAGKTTRSVFVNSKYNGGSTREQFLFREMRITAEFLREGVKIHETNQLY